MAINDKDFYASHGLDFDYKNMLDEYIKGVINQAKIEVLTEIQMEIEELDVSDVVPEYQDGAEETKEYIANMIEEKIDSLKETKDGKDTSGYFEKEVYEAEKPYMDEYLNN